MTMHTKYIKKIAVGVAAIALLGSCQDRIEEGARYTFVGNTVATYLQSLPECSHFVEILTRGECLGLMKAYGQYTCFAPTNEAVERFLFEQDSIYWASVEMHEAEPEKYEKVETYHSPNKGEGLRLEHLSDEECGEIARNHILSKMMLLIDFEGTGISEANMNDRDLTLDWDTVDGMPLINSTAKVAWDMEVENGVVHVLEGVVHPSSQAVSNLMNDYAYFSIFYEALKQTGYAEVLKKYVDETYTEGDKRVTGIRTTQMAPYPKTKRYGFTIFLETDEVLKKAGVTDFASLEEKCKVWYEHGMKAWRYNDEIRDWEDIEIDTTVTDYTDPRNPVNQFVGYHLLDRKVSFENLVCYGIETSGNGQEFKSKDDFPDDADRTEYYVTMNNRILKVTMPRNNKSGADHGKRFLNYAEQGKGQNILVISPDNFKAKDNLYENYNPEALNGALNVIDDVLIYEEEKMRDYVLRGIIRFDVSSICSELTNNRIRWKWMSQENNTDGDVYIPHNYCDRVRVFSNDTRLFYLAPHTGWFNYQGDEMMALGFFDFAYCLPPLPDGTYEIRLGYSASGARHVVQVYLDNEVVGLPIDLRLTGGDAKVGWVSDKELKTEEAIAAKDKEMKNRGYLKAPNTFYGTAEKELARDNNQCLRAVIATKHLAGNSSHWLRFKNVNEVDDGSAQFMHDYFEIVPITYLRDENILTTEKRK